MVPERFSEHKSLMRTTSCFIQTFYTHKLHTHTHTHHSLRKTCI